MSRNPSDPQTLRCSPIHSGENVTPVIYAPEANRYYGIGAFLGNAFSIGQDLKKKI